MSKICQITFTLQRNAEMIVDTSDLVAGGRVRVCPSFESDLNLLLAGGALWPYALTLRRGGPPTAWLEYDVSIDPKASELLA